MTGCAGGEKGGGANTPIQRFFWNPSPPIKTDAHPPLKNKAPPPPKDSKKKHDK